LAFTLLSLLTNTPKVPGCKLTLAEISANVVAPGEHVETGGTCSSCQGASDFAPGIEKQIQTGPGP